MIPSSPNNRGRTAGVCPTCYSLIAGSRANRRSTGMLPGEPMNTPVFRHRVRRSPFGAASSHTHENVGLLVPQGKIGV